MTESVVKWRMVLPPDRCVSAPSALQTVTNDVAADQSCLLTTETIRMRLSHFVL